MEYSKKKYCRNCYYPLPYKAKFCAHCGQKNTDGKVKLSDMLWRFWNSAFHLEGKFLRMVWQLLIPGKVTLAYFQGKHKRYPHPVQFFLLVMFFLLVYISKKIDQNEGLNLTGKINLEHARVKIGLLEDMRFVRDSLLQEQTLPKASIAAMDSLISATVLRNQLAEVENDSFHTLLPFKISIANKDMAEMPIDSLCRYYQITGFWERWVLGQIVKSGKNSQSLYRFFLGASSWTLLVVIGIMSFFLYIVKLGRGFRYVEHFILLLHLVSGLMFLILLIALSQKLYKGLLSPVIIPLWFAFGIFRAFKLYYNRGWWSTFALWFVFCFLFLLTALITFLLSLLVSIMIF